MREGEGKKKAAVKLRFSDHERLKHRARSFSLSLFVARLKERNQRSRDFEYPFFSFFLFFFDIQFPQPDQRHVLKVEQVFIIWVKLFEDICHWD